jgi:predicted alpha/beta hydrolase family esterase
VLVAPANPARFGDQGFARHSQNDYHDYFHHLKLNVPTQLLISENDPWLDFQDAQNLAIAWQLRPINLGQVGHINVASGFGAFPKIFDYLLPETRRSYISISDDEKYFFKFAI